MEAMPKMVHIGPRRKSKKPSFSISINLHTGGSEWDSVHTNHEHIDVDYISETVYYEVVEKIKGILKKYELIVR